jgi:hypothetical protein
MNRLVLMASWIILLIAVALGVAPLVPPTPPTELNAADFSVSQAFDHIERIAQEPHPMGSLANQRVRDDIVAQLEMLGLEPEVQTVEVMDYFGEPGNSVEISNVVARILGTAPTTAVAVVGHYDSSPTTPGANDNGSAVAILLEVARAILADQPLHNDVILVFTDGEEPAPRFGSSAFIREHPWAGDIGFVINLEAIGSGGQSTISGMNGPGRWVIDQYIEAVPKPAAFSFLTALTELIGGSNTDFATFRDRGIAGVEFAYLRGSPIYHTPADTPDRVSHRTLQQHGANTLALTRHVGNIEPSPPNDDTSAVFFNLGRFNVVRYPATWALPLALVAGVVLAIAGWRQKAWREILRSVAATIVTMIGSAVVAVGIWPMLARQRDAMSVPESYLYLGGWFLLTAGIVIAVARVIRRQISEEPDATGVLIVWWALGLLTAIVAPGMGYFFVWPALAGGMTLLWWTSPASNRWWQPISSMLIVGIALLLSIPAIEIFYQFAQPRPGNPDSELLFFIAIPIVLFALLVELLRVFWVGTTKRLAPVHEMPTLKE